MRPGGWVAAATEACCHSEESLSLTVDALRCDSVGRRDVVREFEVMWGNDHSWIVRQCLDSCLPRLRRGDPFALARQQQHASSQCLTSCGGGGMNMGCTLSFECPGPGERLAATLGFYQKWLDIFPQKSTKHECF